MFLDLILFTQNYFGIKSFGHGFFLNKIFLDITFFLTKTTLITPTTTTIIMGFDTIEIYLVEFCKGQQHADIVRKKIDEKKIHATSCAATGT